MTSQSFAALLRKSSFIALGDFRNSLIIGKIIQVTNYDLYVDIGLKFPAVVKKPRQNSTHFVRGSQVTVKLIDYELTDRFLGSDNDTTFLEADAILIGLHKSHIGSRNFVQEKDEAASESSQLQDQTFTTTETRDPISKLDSLLDSTSEPDLALGTDTLPKIGIPDSKPDSKLSSFEKLANLVRSDKRD